MIRDFKFFDGNEEEELEIIEGWDGASWIYGTIEGYNQYQYDIVVDNHYGIRSFLGCFPDGYVITVLSITGPNGRVHNTNSDYPDGWGFDILNDLILIEWVRFRN
jgi:hypothetical protein